MITEHEVSGKEDDLKPAPKCIAKPGCKCWFCRRGERITRQRRAIVLRELAELEGVPCL